MATNAIAVASIVVVGILVFWRGMAAGLVSDDFDFYMRARDASLSQVFSWIVPNNYFWYRPIQDIAFWADVKIFGYSPVAFHSVSLAGHLVSAVLLYWLAIRLGCPRIAALAGGLVFVTTVHAHEVVWWWADLHYAFGGPLLIGTLLAYASGRRVLATALAAAALLTDESAILVLPLAMVVEFVVSPPASMADILRRFFTRPAGLIGAVVLYFVVRLTIGHGIWGESAPCHSATCVLAGLTNYGARLVVRPDRIYGLYAAHKTVALGAITIAVAAVGLIAVLRRRETPALAVGAAWTAGTVLFFVLALWPYASDRFLYYPDIGLALVVAGLVQEALRIWAKSDLRVNLGLIGAAGLLLVWVGAGIHMLETRADGWLKAGDEAQTILNGVYAADPSPVPGTLFDIAGVPDSAMKIFPPGNTGPYIFRNGLQSAVRVRYRRDDLYVAWTGHPAGVKPVRVELEVRSDGTVRLTSS